MRRIVLLTLVASGGTGCVQTKPFWREMLGKAVAEFTYPIRDNNPDRVWIRNMSDGDCDRGCQVSAACGGGSGSGGGGGGGGALGGLGGGLFGGGGGSPASAAGPFDGLAYEVFSNYVTQKRKGRLIEKHRHNYATDFGAETRTRIEIHREGKSSGTMLSCEDLCILDEAKKRRADKVLLYQILEMKNDELLIHLRYSDVRSGAVEISRTLKVEGLSISDRSF